MSLALPFFSVTLFVSAFLLFVVQFIVGKMILPKLGGTPQVWNTNMMFFQTALLAGYAYTHTVSTKLSLRRQLTVHTLLLLVPLIVLFPWGPFNVTNWIPPPGANPVFATLLLLTAVVGIPFFVVATSAPLLQKWFAATGHPAAKDPYFLYSASNLGSMLGLLSYPFIIEPLFRLQAPIVNGQLTFDLGSQSWLWSISYVVLAILVIGCAVMVWKAPPSVQLAGAAAEEPPPAEILAAAAPPPPPVTNVKAAPPRTSGIKKGSKQRGRPAPPAPTKAATAPPPEPPAPPRPYRLTFWRRLRWVGLAFVPSSLMLGITTYISTDISAITMFWMIPLALYLLTFILVFLRWPVAWTDIPHKVVLFVQPVCLLALVFMILQTLVQAKGFDPLKAIVLCMIAFFATALMCHGELARDRPPTKYLTEFYLWLSVGGMLGGVFNGLIAPVAFTWLLEFPLALIFSGLLRPQTKTDDSWTEKGIVTLFPGFGDWVGDAGDELARNYRKQPGQDPKTISRRDLPARGYLLHFTLDVLLPVILGLCMAWMISRAATSPRDPSGWGWNPNYLYDASGPEYIRENLKNPLYRFAHSSIGMSPGNAYLVAHLLFNIFAYGIPLVVVFLWFGRPLRFALGIAAVLLVSQLYESSRDETILRAERSYFGILQVRETIEEEEGDVVPALYTSLRHGTTHHGLNYQEPAHLRRLATTYYHKNGPVGIVMRRFDWWPAPRRGEATDPKAPKDIWNRYWSDARLPASVIGSALAPMSGSLNPALAQFPPVVGIWSDPPYACVGLGTGTMASYARPFQSMTFYEIDEHIRNFSFNDQTWPERNEIQKKAGILWPHGEKAPFFNYVHDAKLRGALLEVAMGDARLRMAQPWIPKDKRDPETGWYKPQYKPWDVKRDERGGPDHFYRAIELDAFSSDAIPVHLIVREAIEMYMKRLIEPRDPMVEKRDDKGQVVRDDKGNPVMVPQMMEKRDDKGQVVKDDKGNPVMVPAHFSGGVLMVHTSNRHVDLVKPVTDVVKAIGEELAEKAGRPREEWNKFMAYRVGKDSYNRRARGEDPSDRGRFGSEYVMVARDERDLPPESTPEEVESHERTRGRSPALLWYTPPPPGMRVWTDDYSPLLSVFRW